MGSEPRFYTSPVDYEAWRKGYMPPSEHILIDSLHRGEANVISSFRLVGEVGWWLVIEKPEGARGLSPKKAKIVRELLQMDIDTLVEVLERTTEPIVDDAPGDVDALPSSTHSGE